MNDNIEQRIVSELNRISMELVSQGFNPVREDPCHRVLASDTHYVRIGCNVSRGCWYVVGRFYNPYKETHCQDCFMIPVYLNEDPIVFPFSSNFIINHSIAKDAIDILTNKYDG